MCGSNTGSGSSRCPIPPRIVSDKNCDKTNSTLAAGLEKLLVQGAPEVAASNKKADVAFITPW